MKVFDARVALLGEGALWHPLRGQLFWFDILGKRLLSRDGEKALDWSFDEQVSAAGWIDRDNLLIASETGLYRFNLDKGTRDLVHLLEAKEPRTRSNDGRADPWGGFWIGTMGKELPGLGAIYRYYRGELRRLHHPISVSNTICFSPDRRHAYFSDTADCVIMRQDLSAVDGWPCAEAELFIDLRAEQHMPDGAVVDSEGCLWNAQWGSSRVARYSSKGDFLSEIELPVKQITCPALGGVGLNTLFATSAAEGAGTDEEMAGQLFSVGVDCIGQVEPQVILD